MPDDQFDQGMKRWNHLREELAAATAAKAHAEVVRICDEVVLFAAERPALRVVEFLFHKRAAKALAALGRYSEAIARVEVAIADCKRYRATARLAKDTDFLDELAALERLHERLLKKTGP